MKVFRIIASFFYAIGVWVRNLLYDEHLFYSTTVNIPTICVGNLAVGGTGKTPHTEYIISLLKDHYRIAILSRGYKRHTKGYVLAGANDDATTIGDEPMQMHLKFPDVPLAVCENRIKGIQHLKQDCQNLQVIILDDAFQYRRLRPSLSILITEADNLYINDHYLPWGKLRDNIDQSLRADIIIVSKCPEKMQPIDKRVIETSLHLPTYQRLYFSSIRYKELIPAFPECKPIPERSKDYPLVLSGIENPKPMFDYVRSLYPYAELMAFPDHHTFRKKDIELILTSPYIITTEKDITRLRTLSFYPDELKEKTYILPIEVDFKNQEEQFNNQILSHVKENNRNR